MMRRRQILSALPLLLAPPGGAQGSARPSLRIAVPRLPDRLDPMAAVSIAAFRALFSIFDPLVTIDYADGKLSLRPALAREWRQRDARTLEFDLRPGVRFHDGSELTAEDVAFTFGPERLTGPQPHWPAGLAFFGNIERAEVVDRLRVRLVSRTPDPALLFRFATGAAQIVPRRAYLAAGGIDVWSRQPIGTGPFRVSGFRIDNALELTAFDDYWGGAPNAARVTLTEIREVASRVAALRGGDADIAVELPPDQLPPIAVARGLDITGGPIANYLMVVMDKTNPVLADARIRRALSLAVDRQAIIDGLWGGRVDIPHGHQWAEYGQLFVPEAPAPRFDPEEARRLVRDARYDGRPIPYRITNNYYPNEVATAQVLVEMWRAVGLQVRVEMTENLSMQERPEGRALTPNSATSFFPDPVAAPWRIFGPAGPIQSRLHAWSNAEFDRLGQVLEQSVDITERRRVWSRMLTILDEDPPALILHSNGHFHGKKTSIRWAPTGPTFYMDFRRERLSFD